MPVFYRYKFEDAELMLWEITESELELAALVTPGDRDSTKELTSPARRLERLAWRAALRSSGVREAVIYDQTGAPRLEAGAKYISVSHCRGMACVLISSNRCGVDIELSTRDCSKVASRFLTLGEKDIFRNWNNPACAVWCAKEALYKYSGKEGLDFMGDISIVGSTGDGSFCATVAGAQVRVKIMVVEKYTIAVVL